MVFKSKNTMPRILSVLGIVPAILAMGCLSPAYTTATRFNPLPDPDDCVLLGADAPATITGDNIATVDFYWSKYGYFSTEQQQADFLRSMAHEKGGNLVKVNQDIHPGRARYSSGRVNATFYKVADVRQYETFIDWSPGRRLTLSDFKLQGGRGTQMQCGIYLLSGTNDASGSGYFAAFEPGYCTTLTRFYCRASRIDPRDGTPNLQLIHQQGIFDLAELYRRQLEIALHNSSRLNLREWKRQSQIIYKQIYSAFLHTRAQYDSETNRGLDTVRQAAWTKKIADAAIPAVPLLSHTELDAQAKTLIPPPDRALVYVIRPNKYNTAVWKRVIVDPYYVITPYMLFINPDKFQVACEKAKPMGPVDRRTFMYRLLPTGACTFKPGSFPNGEDDENRLTLSLEAGKVYFIKMNIIEKDFCAGPEAQLRRLSDKQGKHWLGKCRLSREYEDFNLPVLPDPLRRDLPPIPLE